MESARVQVERLLDVVRKDVLVQATTLQLIAELVHVPVDLVILVANGRHVGSQAPSPVAQVLTQDLFGALGSVFKFLVPSIHSHTKP